MWISQTPLSPLALREGFSCRAAQSPGRTRLQGRDWVLKALPEPIYACFTGSIRFSEAIDLDVGEDVAGAMQRHSGDAGQTEMCATASCKPSAYSGPR